MKLLVYIPSYNRSFSLMKQLETLRLYSGSNELVVVVHDNHSTEPEYAYVKEYCENSNIKYLKNCCNLGGNPNILAGFLYCDLADYIWILSDDDLIKPDAINKVFDILERNNECDLIYLTHSNQKELFEEFDQFQLISRMNDGLGLISQVIYCTQFVTPFIRAGFDNLFSCFPHLAILLESARHREKFKLCMISKADFFFHDSEPPAESIAYVHSFYGFTLLATNIIKDLRKEFLLNWWKKNYRIAVNNENLAPIHSALCYSLLTKEIPFFGAQLLFLKMFLSIYHYIKSLYGRFFR